MKLWAIAILCAFVFLVCFLVDLLLRKLFPKEKIEKSKQVVHLPRRQAIFGIILTFAAIVVFVRFQPQKMDVPLLLGVECLKAQRLVRRNRDTGVCQTGLMAVDMHGLHADFSGVRVCKHLVAAVNDRIERLRQLVRVFSAEELFKRFFIGDAAVVERIVKVKKDRKPVHAAPPFCFFSV